MTGAESRRAATDSALADWIEKQLDTAPPLDDAAAERLSRLLFGGGR